MLSAGRNNPFFLSLCSDNGLGREVSYVYDHILAHPSGRRLTALLILHLQRLVAKAVPQNEAEFESVSDRLY